MRTYTMNQVARLLFLTFLLIYGHVEAQTAQPVSIKFDYLKAITPGENSALSGECDGTTSSPEVTCRFTQVFVRYALDPEQLSPELNKAISDIRTEAGKDPKKLTDELCGDIVKRRMEFEREAQSSKNSLMARQLKDVLALCNNPSLAAIEEWVRKSIVARTKTCKVAFFQNDSVQFKKVGPNKWVANVGPQGMCKSVYLYTMENDPQHTRLWRWSQTRTFAEETSEFCKGLDINRKVEYSWQGGDLPMTCEAISFGF